MPDTSPHPHGRLGSVWRYALAGFIFAMAALITTLDPTDVWDALEEDS